MAHQSVVPDSAPVNKLLNQYGTTCAVQLTMSLEEFRRIACVPRFRRDYNMIVWEYLLRTLAFHHDRVLQIARYLAGYLRSFDADSTWRAYAER